MTVNVRPTNKHRMKTFLMNHNLSKKLPLLSDQFNYPDFHATLLCKAPEDTQTITTSPTKQAYIFSTLLLISLIIGCFGKD